MLLTNCASCAAELGLTSGKKCGRCSTRYCGAACQKQHWERGGHDKLCKTIKKAGGAEVYNANKKYTEAVAVAAEACAEDTKGQTCYICTQALHWKTKEGLVRGCACRGTAGLAHVSCLAEQAKILIAEAEENNLGAKAIHSRFQRWDKCSLCEQDYHGVVSCALGWACWKTYVGQPEGGWLRRLAMSVLGNGLFEAGHFEDALAVQEADLAMMRRLDVPEKTMLVTQGNLARTYVMLGQVEHAVRIERDIYSAELKLYGAENRQTLVSANNYASSLFKLERFDEAKSLLRRTVPLLRPFFGESHEFTLRMRSLYAKALYYDEGATLDDIREAVTTLEDVAPSARRVLGGAHPLVSLVQRDLKCARAVLAAREAEG